MEEIIKKLFKEVLVELFQSQKKEEANKCFTTQELAKELGISKAMANQLIKSGKIKSFYVGRLPRVSSEALAEYISEQEEANMKKVNAVTAKLEKIAVAKSGTGISAEIMAKVNKKGA